MKISVITPVYNGEQFIRKTMDSIHSQSGDFELEHIVCDGLSTDRTLEIVKEYPATRVISRKDGGPFNAINYGMDLASGEVAAWLNADDVYLPGTLQKVADYFRDHENCQWLYGNCPIIDGQDREIRKLITCYKEFAGYFYSKNTLLCENYINQPATFWRTDLIRRIGGLKSRYKAAWDYELWLRMAEAAPAHHLHCDLAQFRRHEGSISENFYSKQFAEELQIAREHGNFLHRLIHYMLITGRTAVYKILS